MKDVNRQRQQDVDRLLQSISDGPPIVLTETGDLVTPESPRLASHISAATLLLSSAVIQGLARVEWIDDPEMDADDVDDEQCRQDLLEGRYGYYCCGIFVQGEPAASLCGIMLDQTIPGGDPYVIDVETQLAEECVDDLRRALLRHATERTQIP
jgi:hypothetical protein